MPRRVRARSAAALDLVALVLCVLAVAIAAFGGVRFFLGNTRVAATSATRIFALLTIVLLVRHALLARPTIVAAAMQRIRWLWAALRGRTVATVTPIWIAARLGILLIGFAAIPTVGTPPEAARLRVSEQPFWNLPYRWDTGWYLAIAVDGYRWDPAGSARQQSIAFFPAYPFLMRVGGALLGARADMPRRTTGFVERVRERTLVAGWLLALGASFAAMCALYRWASSVVGPRTAAAAVSLCAAYPFAVYFSGAYTEPLFLLGVLAAFNAMRSQRWMGAAAWGLFVGLVRPNGFLVTLPLLLLAHQSTPADRRAYLAALMPGVGMLLFSAWLWSVTGRPLAWMEAHAAWGRTPPTWEAAVTRPLEQMASDGVLGYALSAPYQILNGAALFFAVALLPTVWRRLGAAPFLFVVITLAPPLAAGGLMSIGRLTSTLFPLFVALAAVVPRRHYAAWLVAFAAAQGLAAVLFFTWRPLV